MAHQANHPPTDVYDDASGEISKAELLQLAELEDVSGGTTPATTSTYACVGITVAITLAVCPTSGCTHTCI